MISWWDAHGTNKLNNQSHGKASFPQKEAKFPYGSRSNSVSFVHSCVLINLRLILKIPFIETPSDSERSMGRSHLHKTENLWSQVNTKVHLRPRPPPWLATELITVFVSRSILCEHAACYEIRKNRKSSGLIDCKFTIPLLIFKFVPKYTLTFFDCMMW